MNWCKKRSAKDSNGWRKSFTSICAKARPGVAEKFYSASKSSPIHNIWLQFKVRTNECFLNTAVDMLNKHCLRHNGLRGWVFLTRQLPIHEMCKLSHTTVHKDASCGKTAKSCCQQTVVAFINVNINNSNGIRNFLAGIFNSDIQIKQQWASFKARQWSNTGSIKVRDGNTRRLCRPGSADQAVWMNSFFGASANLTCNS